MPDHSSLTPTLDQQEFIDQCGRLIKGLHGATSEVSVNSKNTRGYSYADFVITVVANKTKDSYEVFRNRDGMLVLAIYEGKLRSINWEFIFVQGHVKHLLEKLAN